MSVRILVCAFIMSALLYMPGCGSSGGSSVPVNTVTVNSLEDMDQPPTGTITLRSALASAGANDVITFDRALDGKTINLSIIGQAHSALKGEVYSGMTYQGYSNRDYGKSALYAQKNVTIDASNLPGGITIRWTGGDANPARVLAVYGDLTLRNVRITGGIAQAEAISDPAQPYTLARGGGLAVWGTATLENCAIFGNKIIGDAAASRDRGTYGGGIYSNGLILNNCIVSGNSAIGYGAAGGGIYSVGGADNVSSMLKGNDTTLTNCAITGNRVTAQHAYGGGVFTLSGGPTNLATMRMTNCTVARNLVLDDPAVTNAGQFYFRGGGIYMGGGSLHLESCTVVENEVIGQSTVISNKPNAGGGGLAATIGDAHVIEDMILEHTLVAGNKLNGASADIFSGSLLNFTSYGYNVLGTIDFSQILVPIPDAMSLSRKHYPKAGDVDGVQLSNVVDLGSIQTTDVTSAGTDHGQLAVRWYIPAGIAVDKIPTSIYSVQTVTAGYTGWPSANDDFLNRALEKMRTNYSAQLGSDFGSSFGNTTGTTFYGPARTWPSNSQNAPWISFWRNVDTAIGNKLGTVILGDDYWGTFSSGQLGPNNLTLTKTNTLISLTNSDQRGRPRPSGSYGDVGAIEK